MFLYLHVPASLAQHQECNGQEKINMSLQDVDETKTILSEPFDAYFSAESTQTLIDYLASGVECIEYTAFPLLLTVS